MAPVDGGTEASRRMHEYLVSKQRKQEEYWLRKYGKVVQGAPPSVGKAPGAPRLPPLASGGGSAPGSGRSSHGGNNPGGGALSADPSAAAGGLLPPIAGAQTPTVPAGMLPPPHHRQPKGHAPIFHASEPVKDFFGRNARQPRTSAVATTGVGAGAVRDDYGNQPIPPSHRPPEPLRKGGRAGQLPPMAGEYSHGSGGGAGAGASGGEVQEAWQQEYLQQQRQDQQHEEQQRLQQQKSSYGSAQPGAHNAPPPPPPLQLSPQQQASYNSPPQRAPYQQPQQAQQSPQASPTQQQSSQRALGGRLPPLQHEPSSGSHYPPGPPSGGGHSPGFSHNRPLRNLELELTVIRAIKSREDVLERLRIAGGKLDSGFGGVAPVVLSPVDPLVRLFYRLVGTLRQRTLDAIEAIAAWRRKVSPSEPFIYYGVDYLAAIGPDVAFLDQLPFLRSRLTFGRAADDPFLAEVTPDGIPIEEATTCDLRRGGQRFSSDALRIRMARKVLAQYCGRPMPDPSTSCLLDGGASAASAGGASGALAGGDRLLPELSQPPSAVQSGGVGGISGLGLPLSEAAAQQQQEEEEEPVSPQQQQLQRAASPPEAAAAPPAVPPPALRAITPPAAVETQAAAAAAAEPKPEATKPEAESDVGAAASEQPSTLAGDLEELPAPGEAEESVPVVAEAVAVVTEVIRPPSDRDQDQVLQQQQQEAQAEPQQAVSEEDLPFFEDDGEFIDFALGAIISSLEPPYVDAIPAGTFTIAGWEIDQQLEEVVRGIASPEKAYRGPMAAAPQPPRELVVVESAEEDVMAPSKADAADAAPAEEDVTPPRDVDVDVDADIDVAANDEAPEASSSSSAPAEEEAGSKLPSAPQQPRTESAPPSRSGRIPMPPPSPPPAAAEAEGEARPPSRPASRGSRIPAPPAPTSSRPGSSNNAAAAAAAAYAPESGEVGPSRPPVRVHLRPNSREVNMGLSMDDEDGLLGTSVDQGAQEGGETQREGEGSSTQEAVMALPAISEDRSAYFGAETGVDEAAGPGAGAAGTQEEEVDGGLGESSESLRPPVRVHLRPNSREVNMGLSMDEEGPAWGSGRAAERYAAAAESAAEDGEEEDEEAEEAEEEIAAEEAGDELGASSRSDMEKDPEQATAGQQQPAELEGEAPSASSALLVPDTEADMAADGDDEPSPGAAEYGNSYDDLSPAAAAAVPPAVMIPALDGMTVPLQGPLSGRSNRANIRSAQQSAGGSRPASATPRGEGDV